jgi:hypothetical protein
MLNQMAQKGEMRAGTGRGRGTKKIWKTIKLQEYNSFSINLL